MEPFSLLAIAGIAGAIAWSAWRHAPLSLTLAFAVVLVFALEVADPAILLDLAWRVGGPSPPWAFLTTMFVHGGLVHLMFNLVGFLLITPTLEERIGSLRWGLVFFLGAAVGQIVFAIVRADEFTSLVGASGGLLAVLAAFGRLYPRERISLFFPPIGRPGVPVIWVVVGYLLFSFVMTTAGASGVANEAHLGGLAFGFAAAPLIMRVQVRGTAKPVAIDLAALEPLATTRELREILDELRRADVAEVRAAWLEKFASSARCPRCGEPLRLRFRALRSSCGWRQRL